MDGLSAARLMEAWEHGLVRSPPERALTLLEAASSDRSRQEVGRLPIGERDARLLDMRQAVFGPRLQGSVTCPGCGEALELTLDVEDVCMARRSEAAGPLFVEQAGYEVQFRLPVTEDLSSIADSPDEESARRRLFERCIVTASRDGVDVEPARLPDNVVSAVAEAMERADPQAALDITMHCPACGYGWRSPFDIASFLWTEIDHWARRTLGEVHALAAAYGWSEAEILDLSARRRQVYLNLVGS